MSSVTTGLVLGGRVIEGTEWCLRDPSAWWAPGAFGTRPRPKGHEIDLIIAHWTAGADHTVGVGPRVVRNMKARKNAKGEPMRVSVEFVIGASPPDGGLPEVWQTMDPLRAAGVASMASWDTRGINIERCSPGTAQQAQALRNLRAAVSRRVAGSVRRLVAFTADEDRAFVRLLEVLAKHLPIPRIVPANAASEILTDRLTPAQARRVRGLVEHFHAPSTNKIDAGTLAVAAAVKAGWSPQCP